MTEGYATGWWPKEEGERIVGSDEDMTRPLQPVKIEREDPMGIGEVNWPKVVLILGVTFFLCMTVIIIASLFVIPKEFWTMTP